MSMRATHAGLGALATLVGLVALVGCGEDSSVRARRSTATDGSVVVSSGPDVSSVETTGGGSSGGEITTVVYEYHDASVAPEYHRSYTVTVTNGSATVVVDSYGEVIAEETAAVDATMWADTLAAAQAMAGTPSVGPTDCAGGTSDELIALDAAGAELFDIFSDHCADGELPDLAGVVSGPLSLFDIGALTATG